MGMATNRTANDLIDESVQTAGMVAVYDYELDDDVDDVWNELEVLADHRPEEDFDDAFNLVSVTFRGYDTDDEGWCVRLQF